MAKRSGNFRYLVLAFLIAAMLWAMAHGASSDERGVDIPIILKDLPEQLVVTDQSVDVVNIRVLGSRAALRDVSPSKMEYALNVSGAKPGPAVYEVDVSRFALDLPRGARIVSRSPASIELKFERRGRKSVRVRPDIEGEPAEGFAIGEIEVEPPRVWLVGARSEVLRLSEVVTETIDVAGLSESTERDAALSLGFGHIWMEENGPVTVRVRIDAIETAESEGEESSG